MAMPQTIMTFIFIPKVKLGKSDMWFGPELCQDIDEPKAKIQACACLYLAAFALIGPTME